MTSFKNRKVNKGRKIEKDLPRAIFSSVVFVLCSLVFFIFRGLSAQETNSEIIETKISYDQMAMPESSVSGEPQSVIFNEEKIIEISRNLKNAIEENSDLLKDKEKVLDEIKQLRGQHEIDSTRMTAISQERDELKRRLDDAIKSSQEQTQKIKDLQASLDQKTQEWEAKLKKMQEQLALQEKLNEDMANMRAPPAPKTEPTLTTIPTDEQGVQLVVAKVDELTYENDQLKSESAKVHYNMGNIFFKQGDYKRAAVEYTQAAELMPYDPANHYNLAFVSGEFLEDHVTALKHYQQYLFLNPDAKDLNFVKERILKAKMAIQSVIDSPLEESKNKIKDENF